MRDYKLPAENLRGRFGLNRIRVILRYFTRAFLAIRLLSEWSFSRFDIEEFRMPTREKISKKYFGLKMVLRFIQLKGVSRRLTNQKRNFVIISDYSSLRIDHMKTGEYLESIVMLAFNVQNRKFSEWCEEVYSAVMAENDDWNLKGLDCAIDLRSKELLNYLIKISGRLKPDTVIWDMSALSLKISDVQRSQTLFPTFSEHILIPTQNHKRKF